MRPAGIKSVGECFEYFSAIELASQPSSASIAGHCPLSQTKVGTYISKLEASPSYLATLQHNRRKK
jgi:hypothetical protein